jgi:flavin reductase (DIM6/NTAB) family NADH-FMN oxidoreductase RutF
MIDSQQFRRMLGQFATGVTIITARDDEGCPVGVTASSFNAVSLDPPLILWSIGKNAHSYPVYAKANHFAVHVLGDGQRSLSERFSRALTDKFAELDFQFGESGAPLLPDCLARFECEVEHRYEGGDHLILVGRVLRLESATEAAKPLIFYQGRYAALAA